MKVYLVYVESGSYSDYSMTLIAIFSTQEKAIKYVESIQPKVFKYETYHYNRETDIWETTEHDGLLNWGELNNNELHYSGNGIDAGYTIKAFTIDQEEIK